MTETTSLAEALCRVSTATITTMLFKHGLRNVWLRGAMPLAAGQGRRAGPAFTMRFIPAREDLSTPERWTDAVSPRAAIEAMPAGAMVVVDAMREAEAGIVGDVFASRMKARGVEALVTDGALRDGSVIAEIGLAAWCRGRAAPPSSTTMTFVEWQTPVGCGGVAVFPGDYLVADDDGVVVVPAAHLEEIAAKGPEDEALDAWIRDKVLAGQALPGFYPATDETRRRFRVETVPR
ncbi:ribonuclease activity regulator RraA [Aureimonas flava]|uniref:Ribonuclease activity regulator RraA n=1 Tax=Aureimonas flava TaxID=2320271 RepID=A0A3A1WP98_9HYPH|nr:ribonuclease activity regulator RraA [Aureimonas flava]RIY02565.1 ribonuclease activity regulator RraA [Aureimonas flava]